MSCDYLEPNDRPDNQYLARELRGSQVGRARSILTEPPPDVRDQRPEMVDSQAASIWSAARK